MPLLLLLFWWGRAWLEKWFPSLTCLHYTEFFSTSHHDRGNNDYNVYNWYYLENYSFIHFFHKYSVSAIMLSTAWISVVHCWIKLRDFSPPWHICLEIQECDGRGQEQETEKWELTYFVVTGSRTQNRHSKCEECEEELNDDMAFCLKEWNCLNVCKHMNPLPALSCPCF